MIDKTIEDISVFMIKRNTREFPEFHLPKGYRFQFYKDGNEADWARLEIGIGQFESEDRALRCFCNEFLKDQRLDVRENLLFVQNEEGRIVATGALWDGDFLGERLRRIHWIAVSDECKGLGIAKAIISRLLELNLALTDENPIYLWTGTRYYPAVSIYLGFGFEFYDGDKDPQGILSPEEYLQKNKRGIGIIKEKISERKR